MLAAAICMRALQPASYGASEGHPDNHEGDHMALRFPGGHRSTSAPARSLPRQLLVRVCQWRLDVEIAEGGRAGSSGALALRADQLVELDERRRLAHSLRRALSHGDPRLRIPHAAIVLADREAVAGWEHGLLGIAERLERPEPVTATAVARVKVLLCDGTGPLYDSAAERSLGEMVWWIADALADGCPPHEWGCPVIMKLDPDHVAWTCSRCGLTACSDDLACRPD